MKKLILFNSECDGCTNQNTKGLAYCVGCKMFKNDMSLKDLHSIRSIPPVKTEIEIQRDLAIYISECIDYKDRLSFVLPFLWIFLFGVLFISFDFPTFEIFIKRSVFNIIEDNALSMLIMTGLSFALIIFYSKIWYLNSIIKQLNK